MTFLVIKLSNNTLVWKRLSLIATALNFNHNVYNYWYICITGDRDKATIKFYLIRWNCADYSETKIGVLNEGQLFGCLCKDYLQGNPH